MFLFIMTNLLFYGKLIYSLTIHFFRVEKENYYHRDSYVQSVISNMTAKSLVVFCGFAPIFPDTCYHLTHYKPAAADIPVASDNPVHYADAIRYNARTPLQGSLLPLTRLV